MIKYVKQKVTSSSSLSHPPQKPERKESWSSWCNRFLWPNQWGRVCCCHAWWQATQLPTFDGCLATNWLKKGKDDASSLALLLLSALQAFCAPEQHCELNSLFKDGGKRQQGDPSLNSHQSIVVDVEILCFHSLENLLPVLTHSKPLWDGLPCTPLYAVPVPLESWALLSGGARSERC